MPSKHRTTKRKSTRINAARVKQLVRENYEPGRHDKCKLAVYRNVISKQTGISEATFWRYMQEIEEEIQLKNDKHQLRMFDDEITA